MSSYRRTFSPSREAPYYTRRYTRPRSHSPTPQPLRRSYSPARDRYHRSRSPVQQYDRFPRYSNYYRNNSRFRVSPTTKYGDRNLRYNTRQEEFNYANTSRAGSSPSPGRSGDSSSSYSTNNKQRRTVITHVQDSLPDQTPSPFYLRSQPGRDLQGQDLTDTGRLQIMDAEQVFKLDCQTVAEVTQLLINEDKEMEDRLVRAMEGCINRLREIHQKRPIFLQSDIPSTAFSRIIGDAKADLNPAKNIS